VCIEPEPFWQGENVWFAAMPGIEHKCGVGRRGEENSSFMGQRRVKDNDGVMLDPSGRVDLYTCRFPADATRHRANSGVHRILPVVAQPAALIGEHVNKDIAKPSVTPSASRIGVCVIDARLEAVLNGAEPGVGDGDWVEGRLGLAPMRTRKHQTCVEPYTPG